MSSHPVHPAFRQPPCNRSEGHAAAGTGACVALAVFTGGCGGWPSSAAGPQAARIASEWWLFLGVSCAVYGAVMLALVVALVRSPRVTQGTETELPAAVSRRLGWAVGSGMAVTVALIFALLLHDFMTGRAVEAFGASDPLIIEIKGHQWWWEVHYVDSVAGNRFTTANEIHIPVGRPVELSLTSADVIHSLWVPQLHGKRDLIPSYGRRLRIQADRAGVYPGQCAEFCGYQHARMRLLIVAQPEADFALWQKAQREPARTPTDEVQQRGQQVFLSGTCVMCHTIRGTPAGGKVAPDLTHLASRRTIAAGAVPNTRGHLAGWILDPQSIKPGANMPPNVLSPQDLQALIDYLGSLV
jgi:cytochrome c oxidase subunit II